jgi:hypothetical protein
MKKISLLPLLGYFAAILLYISVAVSCKKNSGHFAAVENVLVKDSVTRMTTNIAKDLSAQGPIAWLDYFEKAPGFFMANDGQLALNDYPAAVSFVKTTLIKRIPKIALQWKNVKIDPLSSTFAAIGADFHENIVFSDGKTISVDGYFTGTAHFDGKRWKLRNLHWSSKLTK